DAPPPGDLSPPALRPTSVFVDENTPPKGDGGIGDPPPLPPREPPPASRVLAREAPPPPWLAPASANGPPPQVLFQGNVSPEPPRAKSENEAPLARVISPPAPVVAPVRTAEASPVPLTMPIVARSGFDVLSESMQPRPGGSTPLLDMRRLA